MTRLVARLAYLASLVPRGHQVGALGLGFWLGLGLGLGLGFAYLASLVPRGHQVVFYLSRLLDGHHPISRLYLAHISPGGLLPQPAG